MAETEAQRLLRERRKAAGLCTRCGCKKEPSRYQQCENCRKYNLEAQHKCDIRKLEARRPRRSTSNTLSIAQVCRMAAERGLSYGQMVAQMEKES